jgi:hypothetical protein
MTRALLAAIVAGAVSAASCSVFGASTEATPAGEPAEAGPSGADGATLGDGAPVGDGATVDDGGAPPIDAQAGTPVPCPATAILCDAFEDRGGSTTDLKGTRWQPLSGAASGRIDDVVAFSPAHSLAIDVPTGKWNATVGLLANPTVSRTSVTLRAALRVSALPPYAQIISMVADSAFFALVVDAGKVVAQYGDGTQGGAWVKTSTDFPLDRWFRFAFVLHFGQAGGVELLINDTSVYKASAATTSAATVGDLRLIVQPDLGGVNVATATTIRYDDVVLE